MMSGAAVAVGAAVGVGVGLAIAGVGVVWGVNRRTVGVTKGMRGAATTPDAAQNINKIRDSFFIAVHASNLIMVTQRIGMALVYFRASPPPLDGIIQSRNNWTAQGKGAQHRTQ